ncbi:hypothetical protein KSP39_PZI014357 [Platanthera zijinensis]|uniref:Uncharacterized protein n=1 Tax=Platanthera zijinensis TaxID=2320716 RepID=A0AAP0BAV9_9ASPA
MDAGAVIIDISSDEENCMGDSCDISEEWLTELLECVDIEAQGDLDNVMVLDELSTLPCIKRPNPLQRDSDDDCIVLDGDPDMPMLVVDGKQNSIDGFDDLLIVGETGHLACRDYPHPRHLCLSFPFNSTPHEKHCKLCHCYVCDSPAPCIYWNTTLSTTDHCHSSEKEQVWKTLRGLFKLVGITSLSEPPWFPGSKKSHTQPLKNFEDINVPIPGLQNEHWCSTTNHASSARMVPVPVRIGSTSEGCVSSSLLQSPTNELLGAAYQKFHYSPEVLQGSQRKPSRLTQSEASKNTSSIQNILASIGSDLLGTDYDNGHIAVYEPSVSFRSARPNTDVFGTYF